MPPRGNRGRRKSSKGDDQRDSSDMISNLPVDVMLKILMHLSLKQAAMTSVLSSKWRHIWTKLPQLIFDEDFYDEIKESQLASQDKLMAFICEVILLRQAPILKFELCTTGLKSCREIDSIIQFLSMNSVEELTLWIAGGREHKLPSHFFSCQQLTSLSLSRCEIRSPVSFGGFRNLKILYLDRVCFDGCTMGSFISSCPLLEELTLDIDNDAVEVLELHAPSLQNFKLHIYGQPMSISLKNVGQLLVLRIFVEGYYLDVPMVPWKTSHVEEFFHCLASIRHLELDFATIKGFTAGHVLMRPDMALRHIEDLSLCRIWFSMIHEISFGLWLIRNSLNLKLLRIQLYDEGYLEEELEEEDDAASEFLKSQDFANVCLNSLQEVHIDNLSGVRAEIELVRFLLASSPNLKTFVMSSCPDIGIEEEVKFIKRILALPRASTRAVIKYQNGEED